MLPVKLKSGHIIVNFLIELKQGRRNIFPSGGGGGGGQTIDFNCGEAEETLGFVPAKPIVQLRAF